MPPTTVVGDKARPLNNGIGRTVKGVVLVTPFAVALNVTAVSAATLLEFTVNVAVLAPAGMVTLLGTVAAVWLEERVTSNPPSGALLLRLNVPVALSPPTIDTGLTVKLVSDAGLTVRVAVLALPLRVAVIVTVKGSRTAVVVALKEVE